MSDMREEIHGRRPVTCPHPTPRMVVEQHGAELLVICAYAKNIAEMLRVASLAMAEVEGRGDCRLFHEFTVHLIALFAAASGSMKLRESIHTVRCDDCGRIVFYVTGAAARPIPTSGTVLVDCSDPSIEHLLH